MQSINASNESSEATKPTTATTGETAEAVDSYRWKNRHEILYQVRFSTRYHRMREQFLDGLDRTTKAIAIIGGSAAFAWMQSATVAGGIVAVVSTLSLVFDYAVQARLHAELAKKFLDLEAEIVGMGEYDFTDENLKDWAAQCTRIEAEEPPLKEKLAVICQAELDRSLGVKPKTFFPWWQRLSAQLS